LIRHEIHAATADRSSTGQYWKALGDPVGEPPFGYAEAACCVDSTFPNVTSDVLACDCRASLPAEAAGPPVR